MALKKFKMAEEIKIINMKLKNFDKNKRNQKWRRKQRNKKMHHLFWETKK